MALCSSLGFVKTSPEEMPSMPLLATRTKTLPARKSFHSWTESWSCWEPNFRAKIKK
eukprot:Skav228070  [mRNA]  locus=scaffold52:62863:68514:+ [translate_table: standard]